MRINHNIPALRTLHQMNRTNSKIDKTMQRLSSGLRINSAADDAAGLAIAQKMDTQVRGLQQANRNSMDGISLIQTAEGALNEVHSMLQRTRELSIQASNGTLTASDRKAITDEVAQLKEEIDRISEHIEYNERKLLNGEIDRRAFSTDKKLGEVVSMSDGVPPGDYEFDVTTPATKTTLQGHEVVGLFGVDKKVTETGVININGESVKIEKGDDAQVVFAKLRDLCDTMGIDMAVEGGVPFGNGTTINMVHREYGAKEIKIQGDTDLTKLLGINAVNKEDPTAVATPAVGADIEIKRNDIKTTLEGLEAKELLAGDIVINGQTVTISGASSAVLFESLKAECAKIGIDVTANTNPFGVGSKITMTHKEYGAEEITITGDTPLRAALGLGTDDGPVTVDIGEKSGFPPGTTYTTKGNMIIFESTNGFKLSVDGSKTDYKSDDLGGETPGKTGKVKLALLETGPLDLQIGANEGQMMQLRIQNMSTAALGLSDMNLNTAAKSQEAITLVDAAIAQVSSTRSKLGAYQNRLEHTVANLDVAAENMTASMSRIQDADMAKEMADYTKDNILAQAGNAMLAQANQRPQQILQLLQ